MVLRTARQTTADALAALGRATELNDKAMTLLSVKDPLAYQAVQVMNQQGLYADPDYDPSDEAEARRIEEREGGLSDDDERDFLRSIGADFDAE